MSKQLIIAEKPSVAQDIAKALGGFSKQGEYYESDEYVLSSAIGHLLGAAGAVEVIYTLKAMQTSTLPPTLNLENPSENCTGMDLVPKVAKEKKVTTALSNSFGFGGTNASLVMKAV